MVQLVAKVNDPLKLNTFTRMEKYKNGPQHLKDFAEQSPPRYNCFTNDVFLPTGWVFIRNL